MKLSIAWKLTKPTRETRRGYCRCGCGDKTSKSKQTVTARRWVRGKPLHFIFGHRLESDPIKRFWSYVKKGDGCWIWTGAKRYGYGVFGFGSRTKGTLKSIGAHKFSYLISHGKIEKGKVIRHLCGNPACVRPKHLRSGSVQDNANDCRRHGNIAHGERNGMSKLTNAQVSEILRLRPSVGPFKLARMFGVSYMTIYQIVTGRRWSRKGGRSKFA